jgi:hypothetical protein
MIESSGRRPSGLGMADLVVAAAFIRRQDFVAHRQEQPAAQPVEASVG